MRPPLYPPSILLLRGGPESDSEASGGVIPPCINVCMCSKRAIEENESKIGKIEHNVPNCIHEVTKDQQDLIPENTS